MNEEIILAVLKEINKKRGLPPPDIWEKAWGDILDKAKLANTKEELLECLTPPYFGYTLYRLNGNYVSGDSNTERDYYKTLKEGLIKEFCKDADTIIEFGAGSGHNLIQIHEIFPDKKVIGCDRSANAVATYDEIARVVSSNISGMRFDMLEEHEPMDLSRTAVLTFHSMEQLGTSFNNFLNFLYNSNPMVCVHVEPIIELYDENKLFDYLAILYHKSRNYLDGYLTELLKLPLDLNSHRTGFGSTYHEGYSMVVWRKK